MWHIYLEDCAFVYNRVMTLYLHTAFKGAWCSSSAVKSSLPKMAQTLLLLIACLSAVFCEHEAAIATPEQIAIAATGERDTPYTA